SAAARPRPGPRPGTARRPPPPPGRRAARAGAKNPGGGGGTCSWAASSTPRPRALPGSVIDIPPRAAGRPAATHAPAAPRRHRRFHPVFHLRVMPAGPAAPSVPDVHITNDRTAQMTASPARYQIRAAGVLGEAWFILIHGLQAACDGTGTAISGVVPNQPALHWLLNRVRDLGLCLIAVQRAR